MSGSAEGRAPVLADFDTPTSLIYGIGNVGRQDDGLGWAFIDWLEREALCPRAGIMRCYQLQLEDADLISGRSRVLFVDATREKAVDTFALGPVLPKLDLSFTSHALSVATVAAACQHCFERVPEVYLLTIRGYAWALQEGLSPRAQRNLEQAEHYLLGPAANRGAARLQGRG